MNTKKSFALLVRIVIVLTIWLSVGMELTQTARAAFPGINGNITFQTFRDGNAEIYAMSADGSGQTNLTNHPANDYRPHWSPDGTKIAFASDRDSHIQVYVMNADGSGQANLSNSPSNDSVTGWSPDGTRMVFNSDRDGNQEIYVMNADGSSPTNLTNNPAYDQAGVWSPDGTKIAFMSNRGGNNDIYLMNADGSSVVNLTNNPANDAAPSWSPDSTRIAFYTDRDGDWEIYAMNADGSGQTNLSNHSSAMDILPAWSPDGTQIVFHTNRDGNDEVYVMNVDGSGQTNLTNNLGVDGWPDWQPVVYSFSGFFQPVDNFPTLNMLKSGSAVPVKFSLGTYHGLSIVEAGYPKSQQILCNASILVDGVEETVTAGSSSLSYDPVTNQYIYVWKTDKAWANTCRQLVVKLNDGTYHRANFKFVK